VGGPGKLTSFFTGDQYRRAGCAFGVGERMVFADNQRTAKRNHHQRTQDTTQRRKRKDGPVGKKLTSDALSVRPGGKEQNSGKGKDQSGGDGLPGRPRGLDDVVLQYGGAEHFPA